MAAWVTSSDFIGWANVNELGRRFKGSNYAGAYASEEEGKTEEIRM